MKGDEKLLTVLDQLLSDQHTAINIAAKVREHLLNSAEKIQQSKKSILKDSEQIIK